jgi:hypothetical protein
MQLAFALTERTLNAVRVWVDLAEKPRTTVAI